MTKLINKYFSFIAIILTFTAVNKESFAMTNNKQTSVGRYLFLADKSLPEQRDLMLQTVHLRFPPEVKTVGDAIQYVLKPSGYTLALMDKASPAIKKMFAFSLPLVDRDFGPMILQEALKTLAGDSFIVKVDRLNRQVSFHLRSLR